MSRRRCAAGVTAAAAFIGAWTATARGQTTAPTTSGPAFTDNQLCLGCHATNESLGIVRDGREVSLWIDAPRFEKSVHGGLGCIRCHTELPHRYGKPIVECRECHAESAAVYDQSVHGQRLKEGARFAPKCGDCHGVHYIKPLGDPDSATAPFNVPHMCAQCHAEGAPVSREYDIPQDQILERYTESIHGQGLFKQGLTVTAVCTSCHTGHNVLPHDDPRSSIHQDNIVATCMKCHGQIEAVHKRIIRGELWEKEPAKVPICVACHSPHEIQQVTYDTNIADVDCLSCHGRRDLTASDDGRSLFVDKAEHDGSIHGRRGVSCAQCHTGVLPTADRRPCETIAAKVDCSVCHQAQVADYTRGVHGRLAAQGDPNAPTCTDCHGRHDMLEHQAAPTADERTRARVRQSPTFVRNVPALCAKCHRAGAQAAVRYLGGEQEVVEHYTESIHGKGLSESGLTVTATCVDCHTAHRELPHTDPASSVHPDNTPETCGRCHDGIRELYQVSVHSPIANTEYQRGRDMPGLPRCADCHSSHSIRRTDATDFKIGIMDQCGKCHLEVTESYFETYHGKVSRLGSGKTAKCHDCHGAHDIYRITDPRSRLSRENIVSTCGTCHAGSHQRFTGYLTHATHHDPDKYPALYYAFWGMTFLLIGTFGFFGLHTLIWLPRSWQMRKERKKAEATYDPTAKQYVRFRPRSRTMHLLLILSFFGLAITGMMLRFSYMSWAAAISRVLGGFEIAGFVHRACAVLMFGVFAAHLTDVFFRYRRSARNPRRFLFGRHTIVPHWRDLREFGQTMKWFLGRGPMPRYGRWTYWEKFDYFAVFWGVTIIGSTGMMLWFSEAFTYILPGWLINVATIIHSDEALLATGFIFTVHFFNTHFRPDKFPMDTVMFTGRMPLEELKHERPIDYEEMVATGTLEDRLADPVPLVITRGVKVFGFAAVTVGLTLVVLIVYAMLFGYK